MSRRRPTIANIRYPHPEQVVITGRLSARFRGNRRYLREIYDTRRDWMLEPFRFRGQEWALEPLRNQKQELSWAGEYAGKWLDAASVTAAGSHDERLGQCADDFAAELIATQTPDGYLGTEEPARRGQAGWDIWTVRYSMTGLLTHYEVRQAEASLRAATRAGEWLLRRFSPISASDHPFFQGPSEGGVNASIIEQLVRLYYFTHDRKFLDFVSSVVSHLTVIADMRRTKKAPPTHAYTLAGYLGGVVELAAADARGDELQWVEAVWEDLVAHHLYPTGGLGYREHLNESVPNDTPVLDGQPDRHHQETCATVEWILLNARLHRATGNARYIQSLEQAAYNALLAAQSADGLRWMYYTPLRYEKHWFSGPTSCCYWSGPRGIAHLPEWVYALDGEGIRVNLYESSEALLPLGGRRITVKQASLYPDAGKVTLEIQPDAPVSFPLRLRIPPGDCEPQIWLNGRPLSADPGADGYYLVDRKWLKGDELVMDFGVPAVVRRFLNDDYGILVRGPEVLAADQRDNASLDLDRLVLKEGMAVSRIEAADGRRRYTGEAHAGGRPTKVLFTPYADCGGQGSRFRTAFPVDR